MAEIVETDKSGRIVIPKRLREDLDIGEKTRFILTKRGEGQLLLQKINLDEIVRRLEDELASTDVDAIVEAIREEIHEKIKIRYPDLYP